jgi:hypothetical protein
MFRYVLKVFFSVVIVLFFRNREIVFHCCILFEQQIVATLRKSQSNWRIEVDFSRQGHMVLIPFAYIEGASHDNQLANLCRIYGQVHFSFSLFGIFMAVVGILFVSFLFHRKDDATNQENLLARCVYIPLLQHCNIQVPIKKKCAKNHWE